MSTPRPCAGRKAIRFQIVAQFGAGKSARMKKVTECCCPNFGQQVTSRASHRTSVAGCVAAPYHVRVIPVHHTWPNLRFTESGQENKWVQDSIIGSLGRPRRALFPKLPPRASLAFFVSFNDFRKM